MTNQPSNQTAFERSHRAMRERMRAALEAEDGKPLDQAAIGRVLGAMLLPGKGG